MCLVPLIEIAATMATKTISISVYTDWVKTIIQLHPSIHGQWYECNLMKKHFCECNNVVSMCIKTFKKEDEFCMWFNKIEIYLKKKR